MITVRNATPVDIPILVELMREFYAESHYNLDEERAAASFSNLLSDDSLGTAWIVFWDSQPAGHIVLTVRFSMEYGGVDAFIDDLFIRQSFRRRGLSKAALDALLVECKRRGVLALHVEVGYDNVAAQSLYRSYQLEPLHENRQVLTKRLSDSTAEV
jgi:ribosomal protein S18 acetylase RimI-like enzyme